MKSQYNDERVLKGYWHRQLPYREHKTLPPYLEAIKQALMNQPRLKDKQ